MSLKSIRSQSGLKQEAVADYLCITRAAYTNIENGKRQLDASTIIKLADLFDVSADAILERIEKSINEKPAVDDSELREAVVNLISDLSPVDLQRVADFVSGIKATRTKDEAQQE